MAKKKSTKKRSTKKAGAKKAPSKSEIMTQIADKTDLPKRDVSAVFDELEGVIKKSLKQNQEFSLPGICKMTVKKKPARKARKGRNPFTGEEIMIKAKPASKVVKIRPLKKVKEAV
ncbi:MAG: HU family DNA-binding protein [Phycisphaeraceae bacterium]